MNGQFRLLAGLAVAAAIVPAGVAQGATRTVFAGPPSKISGLPDGTEFNQFFPERMKIAQGSTVVYQFRGFHTVTFPDKGHGPPLFVPDSKTKVAGQKDAAGDPFWFNGQNRFLVNPLVFLPQGDGVIDGKKALDGSGLPPQGDSPPPPYEVKFTKTGTFTYVCAVHHGMKGKVTVLKRGRRAPRAAADRKAVARQVAKSVKTAKKRNAFKGPGGRNVLIGRDDFKVAFLKYFPRDLSVPVGTTVNWKMSRPTGEVHTVTFGPADYLKAAGEGLITPDPTAPQGGPPTLVLSPLVLFSSDDPISVPSYDGTNHGNGFLNSGMLDGDPRTQEPDRFSATFTKPGTFNYICLVHGKDMSGRVTVTQ